MNINEIEKLVGMIEGTQDGNLKARLMRLLDIVIEKEGALSKPSAPSRPWVTEEEAIGLLWGKPRCNKCNLDLSGVMSYSCPHIDCPCGMGPMCTTPTTGY